MILSALKMLKNTLSVGFCPLRHQTPISERTKEGLASARKRGRVGGRPPALTLAQKIEVQRMRDQEHRAVPEIARLFKVSERTVRRA